MGGGVFSSAQIIIYHCKMSSAQLGYCSWSWSYESTWYKILPTFIKYDKKI